MNQTIITKLQQLHTAFPAAHEQLSLMLILIYTCYANTVNAFLTPQYWSSLKSWGGTAVGSPALLLISSRSSPPTEMSTSSYWMLLLSRIRIISACWDFTWKATALIKRTALKLSITTRNQSIHYILRILSGYINICHHTPNPASVAYTSKRVMAVILLEV